MFPSIEYLEWISGRPESATHDLGSSDLRASVQPGYTPVPGRLADLDDPPSDVSLDEQVADEYGVSPSNVLLTAGASTANVLSMATVLDEYRSPADADTRPQVLVEKPGYEPLRATPAGFGARVDRFLRTPETEYRLDPSRVESALRESARLVAVTNRHNPTGALTGRSALEATAEAVSDAGARLLVDEVYAPFGTVPSEDGAFGGPTAAGLDDVVVTGSLTKFFGFGGLRVGWLVAEESFVDRARSIAFHLPVLAETSVALARRALYNDEALLATQRDHVARNHDLLATFVEDRADLDGVVHPGSTFALVEPTVGDGDAVAEAAWEDGVLVVPGRFFDAPDAVRLSLGHTADDAAAALDAFGTVLDDLA
ncbi:pyridoxal phosphate-dependent aminotransferase [Haloarchaeobius sp. HRN-SO-5]|uniref:pyridoxal phosphate-dependent aminotransferase n=1 Tax=Haloarchaeobius sp. HRN-SO-5 TaxID=3446118 RepID=UPI003EBF3DEA